MLLTCPECGAKVLAKARCCPECGYPINYIKDHQAGGSFSATSDPDELRTAANKGNAEAMYWIANCFFYGENGFEQSNSEAKGWLKASIDHGYELAVEDYKEWFGNNSDDTQVQIADFPLKGLLSQFNNLIIFDLETNGLNPRTDSVIEFAAIKVRPVNGMLTVVSELNEMLLLTHGQVLSPKITEITGITNEILSRTGKDPTAVCTAFLNLMGNDKNLMISYNAQFDMSFLKYFLQRNGANGVFEKLHIVDALSVYKDRKEYPHKLKDAIISYHLEGSVKNSHHAIDDTYSLLEVLKAMDQEKDDLANYIGLFGYNPKYGVNGETLPGIRYVAQPYNSYRRLYEK